MTKLSMVENVEDGIVLCAIAIVCCALLASVAVVGLIGSVCLRSRTGLDIYNRAVSQKGVTANAEVSAIRMFVREEDGGNISVAISDTGDTSGSRNGCARMFRRKSAVVEIREPEPTATATATAAAAVVAEYNDGYGGTSVPVKQRTISLHTALRSGKARSLPRS